MPNFERLKDAYAIIGGIPAAKIDLSDVILERGQTLCGSIACAAGWLALHPDMQQAGGFDVPPNGYSIRDSKTNSFMFHDRAMARLFEIDVSTAEALFAPRGGGPDLNDEHKFKGSDKQLWMKRIRDYLRQHGQLKSQLAKKARA